MRTVIQFQFLPWVRKMRKLISAVVLLMAASPVFAVANVPEPEVVSLLGIGAIAFLFSRRARK